MAEVSHFVGRLRAAKICCKPMGRPLALSSVALCVGLAALLVSRAARSQAPSRPDAGATPASAPEDAGPHATGEPVFRPIAQPGPAAPPAATVPTPSAVGSAPRTAPGSEPPERTLVELQNAPPPPTNVVFVQYGVSLTAEVVSAAGPICDNVGVPCILGPGGGVAARLGWRGAGALYFGGAYELSKQDPNKLLRLAILQQARAEGRYYFVSGRLTEPYVSAGLGVAGYGNEWGVDTWGPGAFIGFGVETQLTRRTVVGVALAYRLLYFQQFRDTTGAERDAGISQLIGVDFVLEQRDPIYTGGEAQR